MWEGSDPDHKDKYMYRFDRKKVRKAYKTTAFPEERYLISSEIIPGDNSVIPLEEKIPDEGSIVLAGDSIKIRLGKRVAKGGEGTIYETNTPFLAKIYYADHNTLRTKEKIDLMLSKRIECDGICYPVAMLFNRHQQFIGYLMPKGDGQTLKKLFVRPLQKRYFPDWNRRDLVRLCVSVLEKIKYLHDRNIIIGDINENNILVKSPEEIYFVDTDSYQIEGFPCPVGTVPFTAPEIQGIHFGTFLRTKGHEGFSIATLLFMIMLLGKTPYAQQGGEDQAENIKNMDFPYGRIGDSYKDSAPVGGWPYMWSHLMPYVKTAFAETFLKDGKYAKERTRLDAYEWLDIFSAYLTDFDSGAIESYDPESLELYPTRYKGYGYY